LHLALVGIAECWTFDGTTDEFPIVMMNPGVWIALPFEQRFPNTYDFRKVPALAAAICYWTALALNIFIVRRWIVRHFDRLVGRR
jgi:hypothetical protein